MENPTKKRTMEDLEKHLTRCNTCRETITFGYRKQSENKYDVKRIFFQCHSYFCPNCAKKKKGLLLKRLRNLRPKSTLRFLTLTLDAKKYSPEKSLEKISNFLNLFVKYMRYRGFVFQYFKIIEFTKIGTAHVHMLVDCYMPIMIVKNVWNFITGSYICRIEKIRGKQMAINYLLKYMSKTVGDFCNIYFYLLCKRRYSYSQNFFLPVVYEKLYTLSRVYFYDEKEISSHIVKFFRNHFYNFEFLRLNYIL